MKKKLQPHVIAIGGLVAGGLLICIVGYFAVISPQSSKSSSLSNDIANAKTQAIVAEGAQARPVPFHAADLYRLAKAMPNADDMSGILIQLGHVAKQSSVKLNSVQPAAQVPLGLGYTAIPISITVSGSYRSIAKFMGLLRREVRLSSNNRLTVNGRLFDTDNLALAPLVTASAAAPSPTGLTASGSGANGSATHDQLSATLALDAFVYSGVAPVAPTAGQPAAGSTTTTGSGS